MSTAREIVAALYETYNGDGALAAIDRFADPGIEWHDPPELPDGGTHRGRRAVRDRVDSIHSVFAAYEMEPMEIEQAGERVTVVSTARAQGRASGAQVEVTLTHTWTVRNGRIAAASWAFGAGDAPSGA